MRIIDADEVTEEINNIISNIAFTSPYQNDIPVMISGMERVLSVVEAAPTIEAAPVKRGKWKLHKNGSGTCDQCHFTQLDVWDMDNWDNFCAHCGADMRERRET